MPSPQTTAQPRNGDSHRFNIARPGMLDADESPQRRATMMAAHTLYNRTPQNQLICDLAAHTIETLGEQEPAFDVDFERLAPREARYFHEDTWHDGNGHSHLQATLMGPSLTVPIAQGRLVLGTWQQIFHLECDNKPHRRRIVVTVMGE